MQIGVDSQRAVENKRVYVVDSDDIVSTALQFMLADELETHVLLSGTEALTKASSAPPELILLGVSVLEAEGVAVVTRLREAISGVRLLIVCLDSDEALVQQALALGANSILERPLKLETVRRKVDAQIGRRAALGIPLVIR